ncbi:MAG: hypothetical protein LAP38_00565 [Acidobacteriia bacterium]|nr:hypothetical protein [Terriglobia bacterium]
MTQSVWRLWSLILLFSAAIPRLSAAPNITSVGNAASNLTFNAPIAQGAIFVIKGSGLGPANISFAPAAFQSTSLSGTSVSVTSGTTTVKALMYYTSDGQVAALLPSNTPTGGASFTLTYNGQTSNSLSHGVSPSSVGIFTIDSSGQGPGIVTYADYSLVSANKATPCGGPNTACGAANPGDTLILWATGLGPVNGDDATGAGLGQSMPNVALTLWLGGVQAPVSYQGRSGCCIGEDQIVFAVPNNVPTGCSVPLVVQVGTNANTISNTTFMPVAKGSRDCTPLNAAEAALSNPLAILTGPVPFADISMEKDVANGGGFQDQASVVIGKAPVSNPAYEPFFLSFNDQLPPGTCVVYNSLDPSSDPPLGQFVLLDGGSSFTVKGPKGSVALNGSTGDNVTLSASGTFLGPGSYTVTGTGGKDIGSFSATLTIPATPTLTSPTPSNNAPVTRSNGLTVTWTGGDPNAYVEILVTSALDNTFNLGDTARCRVAASAGTFTIPPYVMLAIPAGNFGGFLFLNSEVAAPFTATGLTLGNFHTRGVITSLGFVLK